MDSIFDKIENKDIEGLKILLEERPDEINKPFDGSGITPLMFASKVGADRRIIDILIDAGSLMGAKDRWGYTVLHWAVLRYRLQAVELLLSRGSNVNETDIFGNTPLHLAASLSPEWIDGVKELMKHSAVEVNPRDGRGETPLHWACSRGSLHTVDILLGHNGIDANVVNNKGDTPLHVAVRERKYKVVCAMLKQDSVNLEIVNKEYRTPLLEAVSDGHLGIMQRLIAKGANVNVVEHGGNNCLHLALKRENNFHSEVEHMTMLDQFCKDLKLGKKERYSGVVVASYLAHHGAKFYCKNKIGRTPLDLIKKEKLKKTLKTLFPPTQCRWCQENMATVRLQPCGDLVLCENCSSEMTFKRCPVCREYTLSKSEFGAPKFEDRCVKTEATCQELGAASQAIENRTFKDKETQTQEEPVVRPNFKRKASQRVAEPVVRPKFKRKASQRVADPVVRPKVEDKASQTEAQPLDILTLEVKHLHRVSKKLAGKWQQLGRELEITQDDLEIIKIDHSYSVMEQGFQMLLKWFRGCDPAKRTPQTLKEALLETECFSALECLLSDFS